MPCCRTGLCLLLTGIVFSFSQAVFSSVIGAGYDGKTYLEPPRCGHAVRGFSGSVSYKVSEPYQPNERCVWTLRAEDVTTYIIRVTSLGNQSSLILTGLGLVGRVNETVINSVGTYELEQSNMVVVTFITGPSENTNNYPGFSLTYTWSAVTSNMWKSSAASKDLVFGSGLTKYKYPEASETYGIFELSVLIFTPVNGTYYPDNEIGFEYTLLGLEDDGCRDKLFLYKFDADATDTSKWVHSDTYCGNVTSASTKHSDLMLLSFQSNHWNAGPSSGFEVVYESC